MPAPYISVVMGVYNCPTERMLYKAIQSILNQTYRDFEFVICDDGSTNDTFRWLQNIAKTDSRIVLLRNSHNESLAKALNKCIMHARGALIARQDIDDYSQPNRFEQQVRYLRQHKEVAFVGSNCLIYNENGVYCKRVMPETPTVTDFLLNSPFIHGSLMIRKEALLQVNCYKPCGKSKKYEDYELFMRLYQKGLCGANLQQMLYSFHCDLTNRHVGYTMRMDEARVRMDGFQRLGLMPKGMIYVMKPVVLAFVPHKLQVFLKEQFHRV